MAGGSHKFSKIIKFLLYFLTFSQFAINTAISQNLFVESILAPIEESQQNDRDNLINEYQEPLKENVKKKFPTEYESNLPNIPNRSPFDNLALQDDHEKNLFHIPNDIQLFNEEQQPSYLQFMNIFMRSFTNIFPPLISNNIPSQFKDIMNSLQTVFTKDVKSESDILARFMKLDISFECLMSLRDLLIGLQEGKLWAIRMVDSSGKIPNGILDGTHASFGDFDMCIDTELPGKYRGMYCSIGIKRSGVTKKRIPFQPIDVSSIFERDFSKSIFSQSEAAKSMDFPITTSICLPSNCSRIEVQRILREVVSHGFNSVSLNVKECETKKEFHLNRVQNSILSVILIIILFEVFSTVIDLRLRNFYKERFDKIELSKSVQCILAFSFYSNTTRLFKKIENSDSINIFHGIKVISISWIVLSHTFLFYIMSGGRIYQAYLHWTRLFFQVLLNTYVATETFFFISGFLLMYIFIKANISKINFLYYALGRFIRLLPPVLFIIGCLFLTENLGSGPLWKQNVNNYLVGICKSTWWRNVLFINNLFYLNDCCMMWTWYIATDMQLYLISYPILIFIKKYPEKTVLALKIIVFASVVGLAIYHAAYRLPPHPTLSYIHILDQPYYATMVHLRPYNHLTPYVIGILTGYITATDKKIIFNRRLQILGWFFAFIFASFCLFTTIIWNNEGRPATMMESAMYGGFHRLLWSLMLVWVTYNCINSKEGIVVSILSWDGFVPFARLTYLVYLIHPILQLIFLGQMKYMLFVDSKLLVLFFIGFLIVSYILAFLACLICESPFSRLTSILLSSRLNKSKDKIKKEQSV